MRICLRRREFIAALGGAAAWPLAARAQQRGMPVIGYLNPGAANSDPLLAAFRLGLNTGGYIEGRNLEILFRYGENQQAHLPSLASDLVSHRVAVIFAAGGFAANAAKEATPTIPIVFEFAYDPVAIGLVASLNRPGGNVTGATRLVEASIAKGVESFHELLPEADSVALVRVPLNPLQQASTAQMNAENAARTLGLRLTVHQPSTVSEIEQAFASAARERSGGLLFDAAPLFVNQSDQLVALAARYSVPTVYSWREAVQAGGLMGYGAGFDEVMRVAGGYVARILKGEKPADLPVQLPTRFELAINLKTAKALGLTVPLSIRLRAAEVIE
jgi:putative ABC transport system substrate-binding protein